MDNNPYSVGAQPNYAAPLVDFSFNRQQPAQQGQRPGPLGMQQPGQWMQQTGQNMQQRLPPSWPNFAQHLQHFLGGGQQQPPGAPMDINAQNPMWGRPLNTGMMPQPGQFQPGQGPQHPNMNMQAFGLY